MDAIKFQLWAQRYLLQLLVQVYQAQIAISNQNRLLKLELFNMSQKY